MCVDYIIQSIGKLMIKLENNEILFTNNFFVLFFSNESMNDDMVVWCEDWVVSSNKCLLLFIKIGDAIRIFSFSMKQNHFKKVQRCDLQKC